MLDRNILVEDLWSDFDYSGEEMVCVVPYLEPQFSRQKWKRGKSLFHGAKSSNSCRFGAFAGGGSVWFRGNVSVKCFL